MLANLLAFGRVLKEAGIKTGPDRMIDAARALEFIDISSREDFHAALRSNLVSRKEEIPLFDRAFDSFWLKKTVPGKLMTFEEMFKQRPKGFSIDSVRISTASEENSESETSGSFAYSPMEILNRKNFGDLTFEEGREMRRAIHLLARKIATRAGRRRRPGRSGDQPDFRRTMRRSLKYGGEVLRFDFRSRKLKKTRIVLLCDVSGSMESYSRFLIQFMFGLQNELWDVDTFVFSTSLTRITPLIRTRGLPAALEKISNHVPGWSGGTNIGCSLQTFNRDFAPKLVDHRTIMMLISDGWECGDLKLLEHEMKRLKRRSAGILWLNPLLGDEDYEPLCLGIQTARPYVAHFLPAHNAESLISVARTLEQITA